MRVLITSGGTRVAIDSVRYITNMSSGRFGSKLAAEALSNGDSVLFFHAKNSVKPHELVIDLTDAYPDLFDLASQTYEWRDYTERYRAIEYSTFEEYASLLEKSIKEFEPDAIFLAAAVSDYAQNQKKAKYHPIKTT